MNNRLKLTMSFRGKTKTPLKSSLTTKQKDNAPLFNTTTAAPTTAVSKELREMQDELYPSKIYLSIISFDNW